MIGFSDIRMVRGDDVNLRESGMLGAFDGPILECFVVTADHGQATR